VLTCWGYFRFAVVLCVKFVGAKYHSGLNSPSPPGVAIHNSNSPYFIMFFLPLPFAGKEIIPSWLSSEINKGVCFKSGLFVFAGNSIHSAANYF